MELFEPEEAPADLPLPADQPLSLMPGDFGEAIGRISELVDKYWNGSKSLLKNVRFKSKLHLDFASYHRK